ncbi:MAG: hypothetical protein RSD95_07345, partial [Clostridia bacterium]
PCFPVICLILKTSGCGTKLLSCHSPKNGRGKYVVQSLAEYEKLQSTVCLLAELSKGVESLRKEGGLTVDEAFSGLEG